MTPEPVYRLCCPADLSAVWKTFLISFQDMMEQVQGRRSRSQYSKCVPPYLDHVLSTDAPSFWVAEIQNKIVGFACAIVRAPIWFLCDFWVLPKFRGRGIGRKLLTRALRSEKRYTLISTYSSLYPAAMRSYILLGMMPRFPVYTLVGRSNEIRINWSTKAGLRLIEFGSSRDDKSSQGWMRTLGAMDRTVRGSARQEDHVFFLSRNNMRCWMVERRSEPLGYFYFSRKGQIGPLAVGDPRYKLEILQEAVRMASTCFAKITVRVPGPNSESIRALLKSGFRIDSHAIFMSSKEYGKMGQYIISGPAMF